MKPIHVFYKELPVDEDDIFTVDITKENEVKNVKFKKSLQYGFTGLSINQNIGSSLVSVTDIDRQYFLNNTIQKLVKGKKEPDLDFKIPDPETKDIRIPLNKISNRLFPNKTDILQRNDQEK